MLRAFTLSLLVLSAFSLTAQKKDYMVSNSEWFVIENATSDAYPKDKEWQPKKFPDPIIIPIWKGSAPVLKNFEIFPKAFPGMMDIAVGPPAEGIYRSDEKELSRYVEFINEKSYETDNNIEYLLPLEGRWGLDKKFRSKEFLLELSTGSENWLEVIADNKLLGSGRSKVIVSGSAFPDKGSAVIRISAIDTNNKGLLSAIIYQSYEEVVVDPFHKAIEEKWFSPEKGKTLTWSPVNDQAVKKSPWFPEHTPALYKRTYICPTVESTSNIHYSILGDITHLWINGTEIDINNCQVPNGVFKKGENEIIYYSSRTFKGLDLNLEFYSVSPYWVKTEVEASSDSVVSAMLRGVPAKVYVNGKYAGFLNKEKTDEFFGYGLFKDGKNEIAFCILQNSPKAFLEKITVSKSDNSSALVLPWTSQGKEIASRTPGALSSYGGFYLQYRQGKEKFESAISGKFTSDRELIFDSGKRFPDWMFRKELFVPPTVSFNGTVIKRVGNSFVLPASLSKDENTLTISYSHGKLPEPLMYLNSEAQPKAYVRFKLLNRSGSEKLKPNIFFTGEKLTYLVDFDYSAFDKVELTFGEQKVSLNADSSQTVRSLELKNPGEHALKFTAFKGEKSFSIPGGNIYVSEQPADKAKWLKENAEVSEIVISSDAFYNSETTLFPEFHQREWMLRELKSDSKNIEFGPLATWKDKKKFSIFDSFPNGVPVFEKFGRRMETYMKLRSRGYPVVYSFEKKLNSKELWSSAATVFQYLRWLESKGVKVDWEKETLDDYLKVYVEGMKDKADEYIKFRVEKISKMIEKLALNAAPGSVIKELAK